ncbi:DUF4386 family protein [Kordia sp.]|uniref:DUF4386 family protein n=1 Tax=Kordia sp. TaxID=1965332 RepID=UPI003D6B940F
MYVTKLIPKLISIFGMFAILLMCIEMVCTLFGNGISMNLMIPTALAQLLLPIWLIIKGLKTSEE